MKRAIAATAAGISVALFQSAALAVDADWAKSEAKEHGCLNCHNIDAKKKVGPGWAETAANNKGKAPADLTASMKAKPVHANALKKTSDKDLGLMMEWILTLAK